MLNLSKFMIKRKRLGEMSLKYFLECLMWYQINLLEEFHNFNFKFYFFDTQKYTQKFSIALIIGHSSRNNQIKNKKYFQHIETDEKVSKKDFYFHKI